jgi:hypothetical protein
MLSSPEAIRLIDPDLPSWRGQLHCHSTESDGTLPPEAVIARYREAGYDWLVLSDHLEPEYGWRITDTRRYSEPGFTAIVGAELSSAPWSDRDCFWVTAAGLPVDFRPPASGDTGDRVDAIRRAAEAGAFVVMLHPRLNDLALDPDLPGLDAVHAVEVHNTSMQTTWPDHADGFAFLDGLLEAGHRMLLAAGDDAHFDHPDSAFGGWLQVSAPTNDTDALMTALKAGRYYSTQGPRLHEMTRVGDTLSVRSDPARSIVLSGGGDRWRSTRQALGAPHVEEAEFDLAPFRGSHCRVTVVDATGRRAWSNPLWP